MTAYRARGAPAGSVSCTTRGTDQTEVVRFLPPDLAGLSIPEAASRVREWLGLGPRNDFDSYRQYQISRKRGLSQQWLQRKMADCEESPILEFSLYDPECPVIVVKKQDADTRQSFTLMHELGHLLVHRASRN